MNYQKDNIIVIDVTTIPSRFMYNVGWNTITDYIKWCYHKNIGCIFKYDVITMKDFNESWKRI